jgi:hypothetical protein
MGTRIELSDGRYRARGGAATARGKTPQTLLAKLIDALPAAGPRCAYETEEWLRHLGATEDRIAASALLASEGWDEMAGADA